MKNMVDIELPTPKYKTGARVVMGDYQTVGSGDVTGATGQITKVLVAAHIEVYQSIDQAWLTRKWQTGPRYQVRLDGDGDRFLSDVNEWNFELEMIGTRCSTGAALVVGCVTGGVGKQRT